MLFLTQEKEGITLARKDVDMTQGNILKHLLTFAAPLAVGLLFQQLYNAVDAAIIGNFGPENALGAVTSTGSIINMLIGIFNGLSLGTGVVLSQVYGAHDEKRIHKVVHTTMLSTLILCVIATVLGLLIARPALVMMNTPEKIMDMSVTYLVTYFAGISGLLIYNMGSAILRAVGDSKRPLYFLVFSAVVNTVLDLVFVICFDMGVFGVALATVIAQGLSAALVVYVLLKERGAYGLRLPDLHIDKAEFKAIFNLGLPSSIQQGLTSFSNVFVMSYVNAFGADCTSGWGAYNKLDMFLMVPVMALAQASTTFVGQNWGARQYARARRGVRYGVWMSMGCLVALAAAVLIWANPLLHLITSNPAEIAYGERFIRIITPFYITICFNQMYGGALRGIGSAKAPMFIFLGSFVAFRQAFLFVVNLLVNGRVIGALSDAHFFLMSLAFPMGWIMASTLLIIFYRRSKLFRMSDPVPANA
ncbi:MAG: MATE family efflux transporter [Clostridia bacterium]|nr:MATE family efflux transporter [Clostridia bacterium]